MVNEGKNQKHKASPIEKFYGNREGQRGYMFEMN